MRSKVTSWSGVFRCRSLTRPPGVGNRRLVLGDVFGFVDFDMFLQRMDQVFLEVVWRKRLIGNLAQRDDRVLVVDRVRLSSPPDDNLPRPVAGQQEPVRNGFRPCRCNPRRSRAPWQAPIQMECAEIGRTTSLIGERNSRQFDAAAPRASVPLPGQRHGAMDAKASHIVADRQDYRCMYPGFLAWIFGIAISANDFRLINFHKTEITRGI